jgi:branched-chain amino acid transport system substrate-binding protein
MHTRFWTGAICAAGLAAFAPAAPAVAKVVGDTIVLGAAVSLTGAYTTDGAHTKKGYDLAVERINERGGVKVGGKSYKLQIIYYDDESTPARGAQLAERLIQQDGVKYLLGPYSSGLTTAIAPVVEKYKIPMIEGNGAAREIFTRGYRYTFAVLTTADQYLAESVKLAADIAKQHGRQPSSVKIAMDMENDPFASDVRLGVVEAAKKFGMTIAIDDQLPKELNDMTSTLVKVRAVKPDLLVVSGHAKGAATAMRQIGEMKISVPMLALTHCDSAAIEQKFPKEAEGTLCASQWDSAMAYKDATFGTAADYARDFKAKFGYEPPYQAAESTACVLVFADAFQRAGAFDTDKVRDAIAATDLQTMYGPIKFDETGKNVAKPMVLLQIQNAKYVPVAPTNFASGKLQYPKPGM